MNEPRILVLDIETSPILAHVWSIWNVNVALNQIVKDWHILSFAAKWLNEKKIFYYDQRHERNIENDKKLLGQIHRLLNESDFVVTQNGKRFDMPKINTRLILNGFKPPSPYRVIDTKSILKRYFGFTSNRLEHVSKKLLSKEKLLHKKFPGQLLWTECLKGNIRAWNEMRVYNINDILRTEELYLKLRAWDSTHPTYGAFNYQIDGQCSKCGSENIVKNGFKINTVGKYQRYQCTDCGGFSRGGDNLLSREKRGSILRGL